MSATIADDSSIVRTFNADAKVIEKPIVPRALGRGRRTYNYGSELDKKYQARKAEQIAQRLAKTVGENAGVVALVPSENAANQWAGLATLKIRNDVGAGRVRIGRGRRSSTVGVSDPMTWSAMPVGFSLSMVFQGAQTLSVFRSQVLQASSSQNVSLAQKVEQGMGRATRGAGRFASSFF